MAATSSQLSHQIHGTLGFPHSAVTISDSSVELFYNDTRECGAELVPSAVTVSDSSVETLPSVCLHASTLLQLLPKLLRIEPRWLP